MVAYNLHKFGK